MHVAAVLKRKGHQVITTAPEATVAAVIELLTDNRIGAVLVMDGERIAGIISERDIIRDLARRGAAILDKPVAELMTRDVLHCRPSDTIAEVMTVMTQKRIRHLPVVEDTLVGMISIGDVVKQRLDETELEVETLRSYVTGHG